MQRSLAGDQEYALSRADIIERLGLEPDPVTTVSLAPDSMTGTHGDEHEAALEAGDDESGQEDKACYHEGEEEEEEGDDGSDEDVDASLFGAPKPKSRKAKKAHKAPKSKAKKAPKKRGPKKSAGPKKKQRQA